MTRAVTPEVLERIKAWEGLRLVPYQDGAGVWTDGYGNTVDVKPGIKITQAKAESDLRRNLRLAEAVVSRLVKVALTDNQFGALVAFVFNVGGPAFAGSTLLKLLNKGDYASVPGQLARWNKITVKGKKVASQGLSNRRAAEAGLWASGAFVASSTEAVTPAAKPLRQSKTIQGATVTGVGAVGSTLVDTAQQVQVVADYSDTLRMVFVALMVGGIALTVWGRIHLRNREGI